MNLIMKFFKKRYAIIYFGTKCHSLLRVDVLSENNLDEDKNQNFS
jgi:hypothetical protein